jgi:hypothetical protein
MYIQIRKSSAKGNACLKLARRKKMGQKRAVRKNCAKEALEQVIVFKGLLPKPF